MAWRSWPVKRLAAVDGPQRVRRNGPARRLNEPLRRRGASSHPPRRRSSARAGASQCPAPAPAVAAWPRRAWRATPSVFSPAPGPGSVCGGHGRGRRGAVLRAWSPRPRVAFRPRVGFAPGLGRGGRKRIEGSEERAALPRPRPRRARGRPARRVLDDRCGRTGDQPDGQLAGNHLGQQEAFVAGRLLDDGGRLGLPERGRQQARQGDEAHPGPARHERQAANLVTARWGRRRCNGWVMALYSTATRPEKYRGDWRAGRPD